MDALLLSPNTLGSWNPSDWPRELKNLAKESSEAIGLTAVFDAVGDSLSYIDSQTGNYGRKLKKSG